MSPSGGHDPRSVDRRRWARAKLALPVSLGRRKDGTRGTVSCGVARSIDLSTGGLYVTVKERGAFHPDEILVASMTIPWESRRHVPFSLIEGSCRVVRVDPLPGDEEGLALAFLGNDLTMLGAAFTPG